jgi:hypothetical protein
MRWLLLAALLMSPAAVDAATAPAIAPALGAKLTACLNAADHVATRDGGCVGLIYADCMKAPNAADAACATQELAFWNAQLAAAVAREAKDLEKHPDLRKDQLAAQQYWTGFIAGNCHDKPSGPDDFCTGTVAQRVIMLRQIDSAMEAH